MHTSTEHAAPIGTWVDEEALSCPGCRHPVRAERPTTGLVEIPQGEFCHRDGSELCADARGRVCEPVKATR